MLHRWAAPALVLALCAMVPEQAAGQTQQSPGRKPAGRLGQNYPNPFNPETKIPFDVGPAGCDDGGKQYVVNLRVYNVLGQLVAIPRLQASTGGTTANSQPINNLKMGCGSNYIALWDGKYLNTQREAASGVYLYELVVDGVRMGTRKGFIAK